MEIKEAIQEYAEEPLTSQLIMNLVKDYRRPYDKISELVKDGVLTAVKNGLYIPGPKTKIAGPNPFLVANHLRGPSYVSMESALSYWGMIPEKVFGVSSITTKATKDYETPIGRFSYYHASLPYYVFGIQRISLTARQAVMIASREKALCDKIIQTPGVLLRSSKQTLDFLLEDMRIEKEQLTRLELKKIESWKDDLHKKSSISMLIKTIRNL